MMHVTVWIILRTFALIVTLKIVKGFEKKPLILCMNKGIRMHTIKCEMDEELIISKAKYGRSHQKPCDSRLSGDRVCTQDILPELHRECSNFEKYKCTLNVHGFEKYNNQCAFGNSSYLEMEYSCVKETNVYEICSSNIPEQLSDTVQVDKGSMSGILYMKEIEGRYQACNYTFISTLEKLTVEILLLYKQNESKVYFCNDKLYITNSELPWTECSRSGQFLHFHQVNKSDLHDGNPSDGNLFGGNSRAQLGIATHLTGTYFKGPVIMEYNASPERTVTICNRQSWSHTCPEGQAHVITKANYGRDEELVCQPPYRDWKTNFPSILGGVSSMCFNKSQCNVTAKWEGFLDGDPLSYVPKYTTLMYKCVEGAMLKGPTLHQGRVLSGEGYITAAQNLSFGRQSSPGNGPDTVIVLTVYHVSDGYVALLCDDHWLTLCSVHADSSLHVGTLCRNCIQNNTYIVRDYLEVLFPDDPTLQVLINYKITTEKTKGANNQIPHPSSGLSSEIGIGVGVIFGILACCVVILVAVLIRRNRRHKRRGIETNDLGDRHNLHSDGHLKKGIQVPLQHGKNYEHDYRIHFIRQERESGLYSEISDNVVNNNSEDTIDGERPPDVPSRNYLPKVTEEYEGANEATQINIAYEDNEVDLAPSTAKDEDETLIVENDVYQMNQNSMHNEPPQEKAGDSDKHYKDVNHILNNEDSSRSDVRPIDDDVTLVENVIYKSLDE